MYLRSVPRLAALALSVVLSNAAAKPVMTPFKPEEHGFRFANSFNNDLLPQLDIRTAGLCGGMSYAALDYYWKKTAIPDQDYRPANRTTLQEYIYNRQVDSIKESLDKWIEMNLNPGGVRNAELFNRGLKAGAGGQITQLREFIDAGKPVVLGLQAAESGSHQVVAIGYDMGRYAGDLGVHKEEFKIFIYDPNHPGTIQTLIPRPANQTYTLADHDHKSWRTYFVVTNYNTKAPPDLPNVNYPRDGKIRELILTFHTGNDDLRGGNDNVNVEISLKNNTKLSFTKVNAGGRWLANYSETVRLALPTPVTPDQFQGITISTTFAGGASGDNWDMARLIVRARGGDYDQPIQRIGFNRFTGSKKSLTKSLLAGPPAPPGAANLLVLRFKTGRDDLRGGNDNLDVAVQLKNTNIQTFANINGSGRWENDSDHEESLPLFSPVRPEDITKISFSTTFKGGIDGDNWDMSSVEIRAMGPGKLDVRIGAAGPKRFTGDNKTLTIATRPLR